MTERDSNPVLSELIQAQLDETITPGQLEQLKQRLEQDPQARKYYTHYMMLCASLKNHPGILSRTDLNPQDSGICDNQFWMLMSKNEKTAPAIETEHARVCEYELESRKDLVIGPAKKSKSSLITAIVSVAALLLLGVFVNYMPLLHKNAVATLDDTVNAKWVDPDQVIQKGIRMQADRTPLILRGGLAQLQFDTNARVVIEGPAEFQILTEKRIDLKYGRLYATVPPEAIGFTVYTQNTRVVDLGTAFGVQADINGDTFLHVMQGKTELTAGEKTNKVTVEVNKGIAKQISGISSAISDILCDQQLFVRQIDSEKNFIWKGQSGLDLADILGRGNGLGSGKTNVWIDPAAGYMEAPVAGDRTCKGYYHISSNPFVDGVFVPDGSDEQIVSSQNDIFRECPDTCGGYYTDIVANPNPDVFKTDVRSGTIQFQGQVYGNGGLPSIVMHANLGITFDLNAMRSFLGAHTITRFVSKIGVADLHESYPCNADFWVLIDGQVRYNLKNVVQKGVLKDISVAIKDTDRFLTLITTDGGDVDIAEFYKRAYTCDWCVFAEPVLAIE